MMDRRTMLKLSGAAVLATGFQNAASAAPEKPGLPLLPYAQNMLEPVISARTVALHYGKHHKGYYDKLTALIEGKPYQSMSLEKTVATAHEKGDADIFNNAAQAYNHNLYWQQFKDGAKAPTDAFDALIKRDFKDFDNLKQAIIAAADKVFGTGWVWLARDNGKLTVKGFQDAGNPLVDGARPLLGVDVWEHAYYLDYENRRGDHVKAVLDKLVNWQHVSSLWEPQQEG